MAIAVPLLIFLMIGVFEVGWALRGYLVLVNVNREATRYSVRPGYLDFGTEAKLKESYQSVYSYTNQALSQQLPLDFNTTDGNATLIVSHVVVNTGIPCENMNQCDCDQVKDNSYNKLFKTDDLIIHPDMPGHEIQQSIFGRTSGIGPRDSRIDFEELVEDQLIPQNNYFNCEIMKKGGVPSDNNAVVTEFFYDQPQLFGFPLVANPYTDPVPLYSHTVMRLIAGSRGDLTQNINTIGPICAAYPFTVRDTLVPASPGGTIFDILDGSSNHGLSSGNNDRGFLAWNPNQTLDVSTLQDEINYPQMSVNDYTNANDASDHALSVGDYVKSLPGNNGGVNDTNYPLLDNIVGQEIIIPVWDSYDTNTSAYHITRFIRVRMTAKAPAGIGLTGNDPFIMAVYLGLAENCN
jgi:hypothetical protein